MPDARTIISEVYKHSIDTPDKAAIINNDEVVSYSQLYHRINSTAAYLINLGVKFGDRIILAATSTPEYVYGYFATHLIGAIAVPLDP